MVIFIVVVMLGMFFVVANVSKNREQELINRENEIAELHDEIEEYFNEYRYRGFKCDYIRYNYGLESFEGTVLLNKIPFNFYGHDISQLRRNFIRVVNNYIYGERGEKLTIDEFIKLNEQQLENICGKYDAKRLTTTNELSGVKDLNDYYMQIKESQPIANYIMYRKLKQYEDGVINN